MKKGLLLRYLSGLSLLLGILVSCGEETVELSKVAVEDIFRSYEVRCTDGGPTYVWATFLLNAQYDGQGNPFGTKVILDGGSNVSCNGRPMELQTDFFGSSVYKAEIIGDWPKSFTWIWTDNAGKQYVDTATMDSIRLKDEWYMVYGDEYVAVWDGSPIQHGEEVAISIEHDEDSYYYTLANTGDRGIVLSNFLMDINPLAYYHIELTRTLKQSSEGAIFTGEKAEGTYIKLVYTHIR
jgi:hypothetical protein